MDDNGFILNSYFLPREVIVYILSYVNNHELVRNCKLVCKNWNDIVSYDVWKIKIRHSNLKSFSKLSFDERMRLRLPWHAFYVICTKDPFGKNLLRNNCGQSKLKHWDKKLPRRELTDMGWDIEKTDPLLHSEDLGIIITCFTTTYLLGEKEQWIDLRRHGAFGWLMDEMQPKIVASEWYAGRLNCGCQYMLTIFLLDSNRSLLQRKEERRIVGDFEEIRWKKVTIVFENYGPGVRYIVFNHAGRDEYGAQMTGGIVEISLAVPLPS